ncbi:MAG: polymerase subunit delta, partial [Actinomycetota bacterium]
VAFNEDLGELGGACAQLINSGHSQITSEIVERTFEGRIETNAFKIADAALSGNATDAIRLLRHGLSTGIDEVALTAALAMRIRQLARLFNDRNAAPAALGMQPWQLDKARKELIGWDEASLIALVQQLADTDAAVKGAAKDPAFALERLLLSMSQKAK